MPVVGGGGPLCMTHPSGATAPAAWNKVVKQSRHRIAASMRFWAGPRWGGQARDSSRPHGQRRPSLGTADGEETGLEHMEERVGPGGESDLQYTEHEPAGDHALL